MDKEFIQSCYGMFACDLNDSDIMKVIKFKSNMEQEHKKINRLSEMLHYLYTIYKTTQEYNKDFIKGAILLANIERNKLVRQHNKMIFILNQILN